MLFLCSLIRVIRPKVVVEFGYGYGYSAKNLLSAIDNEGELYSFDPNPDCRKRASKIKSSNFHFIQKRGEDFIIKDIQNRNIDFLLIDASHQFDSNVLLFRAVIPHISREGIVVVVHDTGAFNEEHKESPWRTENGFFLDKNSYLHQPHERVFVNWLKKNYSSFQQIHLHTMRTGRMGMTILQQYSELNNKGLDKELLLRFHTKKYRKLFESILPERAVKCFKKVLW